MENNFFATKKNYYKTIIKEIMEKKNWTFQYSEKSIPKRSTVCFSYFFLKIK